MPDPQLEEQKKTKSTTVNGQKGFDQFDQDTEEQLAASYGWAWSFLMSQPELRRKFLQALNGKWTVQKFIAEVRGTKWFKTQSVTTREMLVRRETDPATWNELLQNKMAEIEDMSVQLTGVDLTKAQSQQIATQALMMNMNDSQLRNSLAKYLQQVGGKNGKGHYGGEAGAAEEELRAFADSMGVPLTDQSIQKWLKMLVARKQTVQDYKAWLRTQAEAAYPSLAQFIKAGRTVRDVANPYIEMMADVLEMNPATIDLKNPMIANALQYMGPDGKGGALSLGNFRRQLKADPRYLQTKQATDDAMTAAQAVLQDFGLAM